MSTSKIDPNFNRASEPTRRSQLIGAFAVVYLVWGSTYLGIRIALETIPPFLGAGLRFLIAGILVYCWLARKSKIRLTWAHYRTALVAGFTMIFAGYGSVFWAQQTVPSGVASLVVATSPLWFAVLSAVLEKRSHTWISMVGLALGLCGIALLLDPATLTARPAHFWGILVMLVASVSWAWGSFYYRRGFEGDAAAIGNALTMLSGGVFLLILSFVSGELLQVDFAAISVRSWAALGYLVIFGSVLAFSAYVWLLHHTDPVKAATYAYVNPVVAVFLGWLVVGETLDLRIVVSTVTIVAAVILVLTSEARSKTVRQ